MAVAIPFIATALGATAVQVTMISVAFAVTGVSEKINKAAANVFGEDLVKIGNLAGMVYGAYNGGFEIDGFGTEAVLAGREAVASGLSAASAGSAVDTSTMTPMETIGGSANIAPLEKISGFNLAEQAGMTPQALEGVVAQNAAASAAPTAMPPQALESVVAQNTLSEGVRYGGSLADGATKAIDTSSIQPLATSARSTAGVIGKATEVPGVSSPFFQRLKNMATGEYALTEGVKGVAGAYSASKARQQQQEQFDKQWADMERMRNMGIPNWRQTQ